MYRICQTRDKYQGKQLFTVSMYKNNSLKNATLMSLVN